MESEQPRLSHIDPATNITEMAPANGILAVGGTNFALEGRSRAKPECAAKASRVNARLVQEIPFLAPFAARIATVTGWHRHRLGVKVVHVNTFHHQHSGWPLQAPHVGTMLRVQLNVPLSNVEE